MSEDYEYLISKEEKKEKTREKLEITT